MPQGYRHQLQTPVHFRLFEITHFQRRRPGKGNFACYYGQPSSSKPRISEASDKAQLGLPPSLVTLSNDLLHEGYPSIAERVVALELEPTTVGVSAFWRWIAIVALAVIAAIVVGGIILIVMQTKSGISDFDGG